MASVCYCFKSAHLAEDTRRAAAAQAFPLSFGAIANLARCLHTVRLVVTLIPIRFVRSPSSNLISTSQFAAERFWVPVLPKV